jgi:hypothetical protein
MQVLKTYEEASRQEINLTKSEVFFSRNLSVAAQEDLSRIMGVRHVLGTGNYLGLPSMIGRKKKVIFAYIKDRIWKRINSWRGRALSRAGKEVMVKSVLQAIPSYVMSIYLLPETTIKEIERMMNSFWCGGGSHNQGIRWLAWDRMIYPKAYGGMRFRDLKAFNLAMIAKQGWNFMTKPHTLVAKLYKAMYLPNSSIFYSRHGHNPSYAWRGIWKARHLLMSGCRWIIGSGTNIRVMDDPWLRENDEAWLPSPQVQGAHNLIVKDLMLPNVKRLDKEKIESLFPMDVGKRILEEDKLIWSDSMYGQYSVKSGYNKLMNVTGNMENSVGHEKWSCLWKILAPPKVKHLLWRICKGCVPTRIRLQDRCVSCPLICPICEHSNEDDWHVFINCIDSMLARQVASLDQLVVARVQNFSTLPELIFSIYFEEDCRAVCYVVVDSLEKQK